MTSCLRHTHCGVARETGKTDIEVGYTRFAKPVFGFDKPITA